MERMRSENNLESKLWAVLAREHLVDLSQFHKNKFFDEIPLYSRDSDTDFLSGYTTSEADKVLLDFSLKFLRSVVSYQEHRTGYFAAITVWPPAEGSRLVPNLFVWCGSARALQRTHLALEAPRTPFAKTIKRLALGRSHGTGFEVLEDTTTDPNESRVFISFAQPPYTGFISMTDLVRTRAQAR
jgi:hypothetical protein